VSGLSHNSNNKNNQYFLSFLSFSHWCPTTPTVHVGAHTSSRTHPNSDMQVPLFEQGRDRITYVPGIIIVQMCVC